MPPPKKKTINKNITEGCLILKIKDVLLNKCSILSDPMGIKDTEEMNQNVPVVHPVLKVSIDHFRRNTAFVDGRYRVLEEQREIYKHAPVVNFDDVVGLVFVFDILS